MIWASDPSWLPGCSERMGMTTPHSQLRQFSFGAFDTPSLMSLPHALSEQLAEPMYAQALDPELYVRSCGAFSFWRTKIICREPKSVYAAKSSPY